RCLVYLLEHECRHGLHVAHGISFASVLDRLLAVLIEILGERLEETRLQRVASANRSAAWVARLARLEACLDGREISFTVNGIAHAPEWCTVRPLRQRRQLSASPIGRGASCVRHTARTTRPPRSCRRRSAHSGCSSLAATRRSAARSRATTGGRR